MRKFFLLFIPLIFLFCSCNISSPDSPKPGLAISWDVEGFDALTHLYSLRDTIKEWGVPFTLYVRAPGPLTYEYGNMLLELQQDGHEIGYHTRFHTNAIDYILIQKHSFEEYDNFEIKPGIDDFLGHGITIKNFAYPVAHHFAALDDYLSKYFNSFRDSIEVIDWCFYKFNNNRVVSAYWIDDMDILSNETQLEVIRKGLQKAKDRGWVLNLYGHSINIDDKSRSGQASSTKIMQIIEYAKELGLTFYRMEDLFSNK